ncbi:aminopeptidase N-like [Cataglyphis hispanica]|uniref:aminopeptidase N-like n=1 Tax=Cataglyphis hispanica TaxID=1086592 RepID=UPI00217F84A6|nr:aminopeptidase N-like [Cataglyphis hispanica]
MACLKMLLSGSLTFIVTTTLVIAESELPKYYPSHYDIKLKTNIKLNKNKFYGECNVTMNIYSETIQEINLYAESLSIIDINLIQPLERFDKNDKKIKIIKSNYTYNNEKHIISIYSTKMLPEKCIINMRFIGNLHDNRGIATFYRRRKNTEYETWLPVICFWNFHTQKILPCWDNMQFSSKFKISIKHHESYEILSNMPKQEEEADENGLMWTHFDTTPEIYIYLVAIVMVEKSIFHELYRIDKELIKNNRISHYNVTLRGRPNCLSDFWYAQNIMKNITLFINQEWTNSREVLKVDNIAIPDYQDNDIINKGLILYRESDIIYNKDADPAGRKIEVARLIGYKITQEWLPHFHVFCSLSPWVQKALATFMGAYAVDKVFPETRMMDLFVVQIQHEVLHWDSHFQFPTSHAAFSELISYKGSVILRMLQHTFIEEIFWKYVVKEMILCVYEAALKTSYINKQKSDSLVPTQEEFDAIYSVEQLKSWLNHKYYPIIKVIRKYDESQFTIENVTIEIINMPKNLSIPLTYTTQIQSNFYDTSPNIWLKLYEESFDNQTNNIQIHIEEIKNLTSDQWIIFNLQQTGYYRVNYDKKNWKLISRYLKSENYINIHVLNRAQIIDDAFHLMLAYQITPFTFWDIATYLEQETDYVAWYPMFKALEYMSSIFTLDSFGKNLFVRVTMQKMLHEMLKRIRYTEYANEDEHTKCLRQEATKWLCLLGHTDCIKEAHNKYILHFEHPEEHKILPWWKEWTYCNSLSLPEEGFLRDVKSNMFNASLNDNKNSKFLTCIQNIDLIKDYIINLIMYFNPDNYILRLQRINNLLTIISKHVKIDNIRRFILNNFREVISRQINICATLTVVVNHLYDDYQLNEVEDFMKNDLKRTKLSSSKSVSQKEEYEANVIKVLEKIKIRRIQIKNQNEFVQTFQFYS